VLFGVTVTGDKAEASPEHKRSGSEKFLPEDNSLGNGEGLMTVFLYVTFSVAGGEKGSGHPSIEILWWKSQKLVNINEVLMGCKDLLMTCECMKSLLFKEI